MGAEHEDREDRRRFLKRAGLSVGATLWAVPTMQVVNMPSAGAQTTGSVVITSPPPSTSEGPRPLTFTPVEWTIALDDGGAGVHTIFMIADVSPLTGDALEDLGGSLVWDETELALCANPAFPNNDFGNSLSIRQVGDGFLRIGDGFQTDAQSFNGCDVGAAMQSAFDAFGLPKAACLFVKANGVVTEYCAPLTVIG